MFLDWKTRGLFRDAAVLRRREPAVARLCGGGGLPHAQACIRSIALQAAGVVFVGADLAADGLGTLPTDASRRRRRRVVECPVCAFAIG